MTKWYDSIEMVMARRHRGFLPRVVVCKEMPQWVVSSESACYFPAANMIFTTDRKYIRHELVHWAITKAFDTSILHDAWDGISCFLQLRKYHRGE